MTPGERAKRLVVARDAFMRAAAVLTEGSARDEVLAFALVEGAKAIREVALIDEDKRAHDIAVAYLRQFTQGGSDAQAADSHDASSG